MKVFIARITLITLAITANISSQKADSGKLEALVEDFFNWRLYEWPVYGTKFGLHQYDDRMDNYTEEVFTRQKMEAEELLDRTKELNELENQELISLDVLTDLLQHFITGYKYRKYSIYNSIGPLENVLTNIEDLIFVMPTKTMSDYDNLIARYKLIPVQVREMMTLMEVAVTEKLTAHSSSLDVVLSNKLDTLLTQSIQESVFYTPFQDSVMSKAFVENEITMSSIQTEATSLIEFQIIPVLIEYRDYVRDVYSQHTRAEAGVGSLPGGQEYYQACLNWHLSLEKTPQEIHDLGLKEVERIEKKMSQIMHDNGFNGTLVEYKDILMSDPNNFFATGEEILDEYRRLISMVNDKLPTILLHVPEAKVEVRESDSQVIGRYSEPSMDKSKPGIFWANVQNPEQKPKFNMVALTLHEAEPGHHTEASYSRDTSIPLFRKAIEYMRYNSVPFNWQFQTAYSEGWALYAEALGEDMGIYTAPHSLFGRYASEIHRACRLVVDTGIHAFGWTIEEAENYMKDHTTLGETDIAAEVRRYVAWPGQSCSYKIGELEIRRLRDKAERHLGDHFDLREFHDQVLNVGPVSMSLLERHITGWIHEKYAVISMATTFSMDVKFVAYLMAAVLVFQ